MFKTLSMGALGAGLMYFLDPDRGKKRRALVRDKSTHMARETQKAAGVMVRDMKNRTEGVLAGARSMLHRDPVPDDKLVARIRTRLGRITPRVRALQIEASDGAITVSGAATELETAAILAAVQSMHGVQSVENRLELRSEPEEGDGSDQSQSGDERENRMPQLKNLAPATRLIVGATGGALTLYALGHRGVKGVAAGSLGVGALLRAFMGPRAPKAENGIEESEQEGTSQKQSSQGRSSTRNTSSMKDDASSRGRSSRNRSSMQEDAVNTNNSSSSAGEKASALDGAQLERTPGQEQAPQNRTAQDGGTQDRTTSNRATSEEKSPAQERTTTQGKHSAREGIDPQGKSPKQDAPVTHPNRQDGQNRSQSGDPSTAQPDIK